MTNLDALDHWSGEAGDHWASEAERYDRMNRHTADRIIRAAAPQPGQRILDVGCGNGALALGIAPMVAPKGDVVGLDLSRQMLAVAQARATEQRLTNVAFHRGDAETAGLGAASFDGIVSRFGVMFFSDPLAAFPGTAAIRAPRVLVLAHCDLNCSSSQEAVVAAEMLDIGEVVEATGLAPSALRFYERRGLLSSSARNGLRRMYDADVLDRVALIVAARDAGFTVREIAELLGASDEPTVRTALAAKAAELDARIDRLIVMRDRLSHGVRCQSPSLLERPHFRRHLRAVLPTRARVTPEVG